MSALSAAAANEDADEILALRAELARVTAKRDELLEALKDYDDAFSKFDPSIQECRQRMRQAAIKARAAIANATE